MKFRNYCIVVMGEINAKLVVSQIEQVSEIKPNVLDAKGILLATFSSVIEPKVLTDFFKSYGISFLLFDLDPKSAGFHITKKIIHQGLFGFLKTLDDKELKIKMENLTREITSSSDTKSTTIKKTVKKEKKITEEDIEKMGTTEKQELFNLLIDKGTENLTEYDKKLLQKLAL